ncbi:MAG: hypothetical protein WCQ87_03080 [Parabacteroides sp.]|nr:hypothetical protein [Dysgonamonadaceae bacterium]
MITQKNINWYLESPDRLTQKRPFTRGGSLTLNDPNKYPTLDITTKTCANFSILKLREIPQDLYLQEYDPSLHKIIYNKSIPHIVVKYGDNILNIDDLTITMPYQKNIKARHVLHATSNPMEFSLCNSDRSDSINELFSEYKQQWQMRNMENIKRKVFSKQKTVGDAALLFRFDKSTDKGSVKVYSYDEGYIAIPNYNEYGDQIACSLYYAIDDGTKIIDTYDDTYHYRLTQAQEGEETDNGWIMERETHGFSRCPLLYKRGKVAWEYGESIIEMIELMKNIHAIALKRFGTFGLVLTGQMDQNSFKRDSSTLIINLSADNSNGKQDAKVIAFPEPTGMIDYVHDLERDLQIACGVTFMTPDNLKVGGDIGGNAVQLAMQNDLALATETVLDWSDFTDDMAALFAEMISLESGTTNKYTQLQIKARLSVWTPESKNTMIANLGIESKWLSEQTIIENSPHAAPDEVERRKKQDDAVAQQQLSQQQTAPKQTQTNQEMIGINQ